MNHYDAILGHIQADTPCTMNHVASWAISQGFGGSKFVKAIETMLNYNVITITKEDGVMVVELV